MNATPRASSPISNDRSPKRTRKQQNIIETLETPLAYPIATAVGATYWKASTENVKSSKSLATGLAIEIERRCQAHETPVTIHLHEGTVSPTSSAKMFVEECPLIISGDVETPDWATTPTTHYWVEIDVAGEPNTIFIDPSIPPQVTGNPDDAATSRPLVEQNPTPQRPPSYTSRKSTCVHKLDHTASPWSLDTPTWPHGTPAPATPAPTDGGSEVTINANTIVNIDARDGLAQLPNDSIDVIITSPPYRLQRSYPEAEAIWDASPQCEHNWITEELYTDTPIRTNGGAGFNSSDDPKELRNERWRESTYCTQCNAWKGQLGLEPTVDQYINHLITIFEHAKRVLKPTGSLWVNIADSYCDGHTTDDGSYRDGPRKALAGIPPKFELTMREAGWIPRERIIWKKNNPTPDPAHDRRTPTWEPVFRFVLNEDYIDDTDQSALNFIETNTAQSQTSHTAPMPADLVAELVSTTLPDDQDATLLDPFAGSGTVPLEAAKHGYNYLGFEISDEYAANARDRLKPYNLESKSLTGQTGLSNFS